MYVPVPGSGEGDPDSDTLLLCWCLGMESSVFVVTLRVQSQKMGTETLQESSEIKSKESSAKASLGWKKKHLLGEKWANLLSSF